jgi:hypothetical protein
LGPADRATQRFARAYRYFRYSRTRQRARSPQTNPTLILGRAADAEVPLLGIESGAITNISPRVGCRYSLGPSRRCVPIFYASEKPAVPRALVGAPILV